MKDLKERVIAAPKTANGLKTALRMMVQEGLDPM